MGISLIPWTLMEVSYYHVCLLCTLCISYIYIFGWFICLFSDPCNSGEYNTSREDQRRPHKRRPEGRTQMRIQDPPIKPSSSLSDGTRRPLKQNVEQRFKNVVGSVQKPMIQRSKPLSTQQKQKASQEVSVATNNTFLFSLSHNRGHVVWLFLFFYCPW